MKETQNLFAMLSLLIRLGFALDVTIQLDTIVNGEESWLNVATGTVAKKGFKRNR